MASPWWVWYNVQSGKPAQVIQEPTAAAVQKATGFPPLAGPFTTRGLAEKWLSSSGTRKRTTGHDINPISAAGSALGTVSDFLKRLTEASLWERIGEVVLGLILIAVGIARITKAVPAATKIARAVA